jgi:glycosyltransferase involved in cell wall biosynthesis
LAGELREVRFYTLFSHEGTDAAWAFRPPPEISPVSFGPGESAENQARLWRAGHEWAKGGRIIQWLIEHEIRAIVVAGYNDAGRLRVIRWCRRHGVACFVWGDSNVRGDRARGLKAWIKRAYVGKVLRYSAGAMPFGTLGQDYFAKYGMSRDSMFLMPFEPDYALIEGISEQIIAAAAGKFNLLPGQRRIIFSGRLVQLKRLDLLLQAFEAISQQRPDWDLLMVGDGPLRDELKAAVPKALASRVTWTGFLDDQQTLGALYRSADVLVLPSDRDAWALVINEAAAAGLAIVCTDVVGAAAELVREGVNGFLFPRGNLAQFIDRLLKVTAPDQIDAMKSASTGILADWRRTADPVDGLRRALRHAGVLPA